MTAISLTLNFPLPGTTFLKLLTFVPVSPSSDETQLGNQWALQGSEKSCDFKSAWKVAKPEICRASLGLVLFFHVTPTGYFWAHAR